MEHQQTEEDLKAIAKQLSHPKGKHGIKTGESMNASNIGMTCSAIDALNLRDEEMVLEIGHGNGGHIANILSKANGLKYFGADISETIIAEAERLNQVFLNTGMANFHLTSGNDLPFASKQFDKVFIVNTIYFWRNPLNYLIEIRRVLKSGGVFALCFADKSFMEKLPFTKYGFTLYESDIVIDLLKNAGFDNVKGIKKTEQIKSNAGFMLEREYYIISAVG
jgi:SAM-dependent methyltransferase